MTEPGTCDILTTDADPGTAPPGVVWHEATPSGWTLTHHKLGTWAVSGTTTYCTEVHDPDGRLSTNWIWDQRP